MALEKGPDTPATSSTPPIQPPPPPPPPPSSPSPTAPTTSSTPPPLSPSPSSSSPLPAATTETTTLALPKENTAAASSTPTLPQSSPPSNTPEPENTVTTPLLLHQREESTSLPPEAGPTPEPPLSSHPKTFANVFLALVGAGVLGLPYSFRNAGWVMGLLTLSLVALLTYHCMMLLVLTRRKLESSPTSSSDSASAETSRTPTKIKSFGDFGDHIFGRRGRLVVDLLIVFAHAAFCIGYLSFIADALAHIINHDADVTVGPASKIIAWLAPKTLYVWGCFPFQLGLNSVQGLTTLAPFSIFADVADFGAMAVVIVKDVTRVMARGGVNIGGLKMWGDFPMFFNGLGVALYSFEGIAMVLPLESEAREKEKFGRVLGFAMLFIALMYGFFAVLGYFAFGEETEPMITSNLGEGVLSTLVKLGIVINMFVTLPIMMNPVYEVVERRLRGGRFCLRLRWLLVLLVCLVAWLVPDFTNFMALVGSGLCCILGFVLPSLFHLMVFEAESTWRQKLLDASIMALGVLLTFSGFVFGWKGSSSH